MRHFREPAQRTNACASRRYSFGNNEAAMRSGQSAAAPTHVRAVVDVDRQRAPPRAVWHRMCRLRYGREQLAFDALGNDKCCDDHGQRCAHWMGRGARVQAQRRRPRPTHRVALALACAGTDQFRFRNTALVGGERRCSRRRRYRCSRWNACPSAGVSHRHLRRLAERVRLDDHS